MLAPSECVACRTRISMSLKRCQGIHTSSHLPGGEVEIALRDFGWGESCRPMDIPCVAPLPPPEKCFARARIFRPSLRGDRLCRHARKRVKTKTVDIQPTSRYSREETGDSVRGAHRKKQKFPQKFPQ